MSRVRLMLIALGMAFALPALTHAAESAATTPSVPGTAPTTLSGTWRSSADETPLSTAFDESVWGKNAVAIRTVQMIVKPTGDAALTVNRKVVDGRGRTVRGSSSIEHAQLLLGPVEKSDGVRCDLAVTVKHAERRYPDDPDATWPLDGLRVTVTTFADDPATLEVRVDTPEGRGSFWEKLRRDTTQPVNNAIARR